jgi:hypothetical protein
LYFRFCLSYRDVEKMMAERGIVVTYETIRDWSQKFGGTYAKPLRSRTARPGDLCAQEVSPTLSQIFDCASRSGKTAENHFRLVEEKRAKTAT